MEQPIIAHHGDGIDCGIWLWRKAFRKDVVCLNIGLVTVFSFLERATDRYIYGSEQVMETFMVQNKWWRVHYVALKQRVFSGQHQELATTDLG
jgi:hypothetical protein